MLKNKKDLENENRLENIKELRATGIRRFTSFRTCSLAIKIKNGKVKKLI